jgi:hypothetical protein
MTSRMRPALSCLFGVVLVFEAAIPAFGDEVGSLGARCAAARDDDRVRSIPASVVDAAARALGLQTSDRVWVRGSTVSRCMKGAVWLCNHGANLTCAKADVSKTSAGAEAYCKAFPNSDVVPMAATGHDTIYAWGCVGTHARIKNAEAVDERGFIASQWRRLGP